MANIRGEVVQALYPYEEWQAMRVAARELIVNSNGDLVHGCSVCVVADYFGLTTAELAEQARNNVERINLIARLSENDGHAADVIELLRAYGIYLADETFASYADMMRELQADEGNWEGALAWNGHIIRARQNGARIDFWDPQSGSDDSPVPTNQELVLVTFNAG